MAKFVFITGGVVSGLGKGLTAASLAMLLKARGCSVALQKIDPYFNVDSSNLSPYQHGEIFVTDDGTECDLVIGHYERIADENLDKFSDVTSGRIYSSVIAKEREGRYEGRTVQVVPHITDEIKSCIRALESRGADIIITEIGGTVGDIECHPFLEAIRQLQPEVGRDNVAYVHVTLVPYIEMSGEQKTKPTQHSVKELQNVGIQPDIIVCRSEYPIGESSKKKLSLFCNVSPDCIIENLTTDELYNVPLRLENENFAAVVLRKLRLDAPAPDLSRRREFCGRADALKSAEKSVKIGVVGKYVQKPDAYLSLTEALFYGGVALGARVQTVFIASDSLTAANAESRLAGLDGVIVPAGFGSRGFEGKIAAAEFCRKNNIPCFMSGLGFQAGVIEFARNAVRMPNAVSAEFDPAAQNPLIVKRGGNLPFKKGARNTALKDGSRLASIYKATKIAERHRHKFEVNPAARAALESAGLIFCGVGEPFTPEYPASKSGSESATATAATESGSINTATNGTANTAKTASANTAGGSGSINIATAASGSAASETVLSLDAFELPAHKFYIGVAFRPEFTARPSRPAPLLTEFLRAALSSAAE
jgi:CTP synthase